MSTQTIQRPTICRQVVLSRKDGAQFPIGRKDQTPIFVTEMPATVVGLVSEADPQLSILVMIGERWLRCPHKDLVGSLDFDDTMVWSWPPRS